MNLADFILLEQTGKEDGLPLFTWHTSVSKLWTRERAGWVKTQNDYSDEHF